MSSESFSPIDKPSAQIAAKPIVSAGPASPEPPPAPDSAAISSPTLL